MNRCLITYQPTQEGLYSLQALKKLAPGLTGLSPLPLNSEQLRQESIARSDKMSIQGVQPKLSALLSIKNQAFEIVDAQGRYILKPQSNLYPHLPENEDLTMHLASLVGIEVPIHGLVPDRDGAFVYFIKRFDRKGQKQKVATEDFAQLAGKTRETKYSSSLEQIIKLIEEYCSFPKVEKLKLFERTLFNYLVGNEDMHLKNYSVITEQKLTRLAPAYDFLNSSIVLRNPEEMALPLRGKKRGLTHSLLVRYFAMERLDLNAKSVEAVLNRFFTIIPLWRDWIDRSFLPEDLKTSYQKLIAERTSVLFPGDRVSTGEQPK